MLPHKIIRKINHQKSLHSSNEYPNRKQVTCIRNTLDRQYKLNILIFIKVNLRILDFFPYFFFSCVSKVQCEPIQWLIRLYWVFYFDLLPLQIFKCVVIVIDRVSSWPDSEVTLEGFTLLQKQSATNAFGDSCVQFVHKRSKVIFSLLVHLNRNVFIEVFLNIQCDVLFLREITGIVGFVDFRLDGWNLPCLIILPTSSMINKNRYLSVKNAAQSFVSYRLKSIREGFVVYCLLT